jgi:hypothetical protein
LPLFAQSENPGLETTKRSSHFFLAEWKVFCLENVQNVVCRSERRRKISENCSISTFMSTKKFSKPFFGGKVSSQMKTEKLIWRGKNRDNLCIFRYIFIMENKSRVSEFFLGLRRMSLGEMAAIKS